MLNTVRIPISRRGPAANLMEGWNICANMNPMPTVSKHVLTPAGLRSILTPSASRTSALPVEPDIARLPCLATRTPAPAMTKAAVVEMLNVLEASPPVPAVSTSGPSTSTCSDESRMTWAMPAISSGVSPFIRRAVTRAPIWAGVASPAMITLIASAAVSRVSEQPETSLSIAS